MLEDLEIGGASEISVGSSESGILHWLIDSRASYADAAALAAAKAAGAASGSRSALSGTNIFGVDATGVATGNWRLHVGVIDLAGNASNVLSGDFAAVSGALRLSGDPLQWNGGQLIFNAA